MANHHDITPAFLEKDAIKDIDFQAFIAAVWRNRWKLIFGSLIGGLLALLLLLSLPLPKTIEAQIRIEPELSTAGEVTHIDTEVKVINSWPMIAEAVDALGVTANVTRGGGHLAHRLKSIMAKITSSENARDEKITNSIRLDALRVPEKYYKKRLRLIVQQEGDYILESPSGEKLLRGEVGVMAMAEEPAGSKDVTPLQIRVGAISAVPGQVFVIRPQSREDYIRQMVKAVESQRIGVRNSNGIISISIKHEDGEFAQRFLDVLSNIYIHNSLTRGARGKIKTLASLKLRNEQIEERLRAAESMLEQFRTEEKTVDLPQESVRKIGQLAEWESKLNELKAERAEMAVSRTEEHPSMQALNQQIRIYEKQIESLEAELSRMPEVERRLFQLTRDVEIFRKIFSDNAIEISKLTNEVAGLTGYAQILSQAVITPSPLVLYMAVAVIVGGGLTLFMLLTYIFFRSTAIFSVIRTPDMLRTAARLPVIASIPRSGGKPSRSKKKPHTVLLESRDKAATVLKELESKINYITYGAGNNILLFTSDLENQGKSFVSANFALLSAQSRRTLLIDGDVVNGKLHHNFASPQRPGFSDLVVGKATLDEVISNPIEGKLWFIPSGTGVPSHNLLHDYERLQGLMKTLAGKFDLVIVDYPALVTQIDDPKLLAFAGSIFLVVRQGESAARVKRFLAKYPQGLAKVSAVILNDVVE